MKRLLSRKSTAITALLCLLSVLTLSRRHVDVWHDRHSVDDADVEHRPLSDEPVVSTCSRRSDQRGLHQRVLSFSVYGNLNNTRHFARYVLPLKETVQRIATLYPDWVVRIYHDAKDDKRLADEFRSYGHVDLCYAVQVLAERQLWPKTFAMNWRFLPLIDPTVDFFMSRDADSPILKREAAAVQHWLETNRTFHIMRDNPRHCTPMLGGLWGAKLYVKRPLIAAAVSELLKKRVKSLKGVDQFLLWRHIWPVAKKDTLAHDAYCCNKFPLSLPFPTRRDGHDFIGMVAVDGPSAPAPCPVACRPKAHLDWTDC